MKDLSQTMIDMLDTYVNKTYILVVTTKKHKKLGREVSLLPYKLIVSITCSPTRDTRRLKYIEFNILYWRQKKHLYVV